MIPERNVIGNSAKSVFFEDVNDIDIYIEDTAAGYEKIFSLLFSRVFDGKYKLEKVFPLGGRRAVIDYYESQKDSVSTRPSLFIIDGDLYILTGDTQENKKGLYKFPFYCVENILIDPDAVHSILDEEDPINEKYVLINKFNYSEWLESNEESLFHLFLEYAITFKVNPSEQSVAYSVNNLVSNNSGCIDKNKLDKRIKYLREKAIESVGEVEYEKEKEIVLNNLEANSCEKIDCISGKDYLLPLFTTRMKSVVKTKIPNINFKLRLAKVCNIEKIRESVLYVSEVPNT